MNVGIGSSVSTHIGVITLLSAWIRAWAPNSRPERRALSRSRTKTTVFLPSRKIASSVLINARKTRISAQELILHSALAQTRQEGSKPRAPTVSAVATNARLCASGVHAMGISGLQSLFYLDYYPRRAFQLESKID